MTLEEYVFRKLKPNYNKLLEYGFIKDNNSYIYKTNILNGEFKVIITIKDDKVTGSVLDDFDEEYMLLRVENTTNSYALTVRDEYIKLLNSISSCFDEYPFISRQGNLLAKYIKDNYNDEVDFPWESKANKDSGVFRSHLNSKWYGIIMPIEKNKITGKSNELIEVLNLKIPDSKLKTYLNQNGIYECYHMNKKKWISIILDDSLSDEYLIHLLNQSHDLIIGSIKSLNEWIIPANPKYFDVEKYLDNNKDLIWKQNKGIKSGDIVYIYLAEPYSCIMYKCIVLKDHIYSDYFGENNSFSFKILKKYKYGKYNYNILKENKCSFIRGPRRISKELSDYIKENDK